MRQIRKSNDPVAFRVWREAIRPRTFVPPWNEFPDPPRGLVRETVAADQAQICCYCCATIARGNYHIEHFRPRDPYVHLTYKWRNLLASCQTWRAGILDGEVIETQQHCGDAKGNIFEDGVMVDPQLAGIEKLFLYSLAGRVHASKSLRTRKAAVERTIAILNLNAPSLIARRARILAQAAAHIETMTRAEWRQHYVEPNSDGLLQEFWPALQYNYERHWRYNWP